MTGSGTVETPRGAPDGKVHESDLISVLPARSANRDVRVGIFVLAGIMAFLVALFTLTDVGTFRGRYYATTVIDDAHGMRRGDPVQMRGVNIGRVVEFSMIPDGVAVRMEIYNRYSIPEDSRIAVRSAGLLGGMVVDVDPGQSAQRVRADQVLPATVEGDLIGTALGVGTRADTVLDRMSMLLTQQNIGSVGESAAELQILLAELNAIAAGQREELASITTSLRRSAEGVERATAGPELERTVANMDALTSRLDDTSRTLGQASASLEAVLGRLERGEGTLGRLSADDELYVNMNAAVTAVQELVADIQRDPRRYINVRIF
jgi:phospholipid/cholesterol/gamma-HCH transport system substrate-binding protein